eukprot:12426614-Karenia_brevis.AAC.1
MISCTSSKLALPAQYQQPVSLARIPHMSPVVPQPVTAIVLQIMSIENALNKSRMGNAESAVNNSRRLGLSIDLDKYNAH